MRSIFHFLNYFLYATFALAFFSMIFLMVSADPVALLIWGIGTIVYLAAFVGSLVHDLKSRHGSWRAPTIFDYLAVLILFVAVCIVLFKIFTE